MFSFHHFPTFAHVRIMAAILSLLILSLAIKPCADGLVDQFSQETKQVADHPGQQHNHGQDAEDECSPLCSCQCCHIHLLTKEAAEASVLPDVTIYSHRYLENLSQEVTRSILQPPQV